VVLFIVFRDDPQMFKNLVNTTHFVIGGFSLVFAFLAIFFAGRVARQLKQMDRQKSKAHWLSQLVVWAGVSSLTLVILEILGLILYPHEPYNGITTYGFFFWDLLFYFMFVFFLGASHIEKFFGWKARFSRPTLSSPKNSSSKSSSDRSQTTRGSTQTTLRASLDDEDALDRERKEELTSNEMQQRDKDKQNPSEDDTSSSSGSETLDSPREYAPEERHTVLENKKPESPKNNLLQQLKGGSQSRRNSDVESVRMKPSESGRNSPALVSKSQTTTTTLTEHLAQGLRMSGGLKRSGDIEEGRNQAYIVLNESNVVIDV